MKYKIKDLCTINPKYKGDRAIEVPYVSMASISSLNKEINTEEKINFKENFSKYKAFQKNDILIAQITPCFENGKVALASIKIGLCSKDLVVIRCDEKKLNPEFLFLLIQSKFFLKNGTLNMNGTGGQKRISLNFLENFLIPIPSLEIQNKICNKLKKLKKLENYKFKQLDLCKKIKESFFYETFGDPFLNEKKWDKSLIGEKFEISSGGTPDRKKQEYYVQGNIPWIKTGEIDFNYIKNSEEKITKLGLENSRCQILPKETLVLAMYGGGSTRGKVGLLKIKATTNQACCVILPNKEFNMKFLFELLKLSYNNLRALSQGGSRQNLNLNLIKSFEIIVPPYDIQNSFCQKIKEIENIENIISKSKLNIYNLFDSIIEKLLK